jgi:hypothetical protein
MDRVHNLEASEDLPQEAAKKNANKAKERAQEAKGTGDGAKQS